MIEAEEWVRLWGLESNRSQFKFKQQHFPVMYLGKII